MPVTRKYDWTVAEAEPDDHGNVTLTARTNTTTVHVELTPDEARTIGSELLAAASAADAYRLEIAS